MKIEKKQILHDVFHNLKDHDGTTTVKVRSSDHRLIIYRGLASCEEIQRTRRQEELSYSIIVTLGLKLIVVWG